MNLDHSKFIPGIRIDILGFDFDGVIADTASAFLRILSEEYGYCNFSLDRITSFQVEECLEIPERTVSQVFQSIMDDSLATGLQPLPGAIDGLEHLSRLGNLTIITARDSAGPVEAWLDYHCRFPTRQKIHVIATGDHDDKLRYVLSRDLRYFIDDRAETCRQLAAAGVCPIVFSHPWNRGRHSFPAVAGWDELLEMILSGQPAFSHRR